MGASRSPPFEQHLQPLTSFSVGDHIMKLPHPSVAAAATAQSCGVGCWFPRYSAWLWHMRLAPNFSAYGG